MTAFSREVIHDVTEVIVTRREVDSLGSKWDSLEFDIVDENGISKTLHTEDSVVFLREYTEPLCAKCYLDIKDLSRKPKRRR